MIPICGGIRYSYSIYYGILIQPYVYGLLHYVLHGEVYLSVASQLQQLDEWAKLSKWGYQLGAGVDFGLTSYFGVFVEGMYGYTGATFKDRKTRNVEGYFIYYGVTWRTSYGLIE